MAGPRVLAWTLLSVSFYGAMAGCAGAPPQPPPKPAQRTEGPAPQPSAEPALPAPSPSEPLQSTAERPDTREVDVVDPGGEGSGRPSLVEAAHAEKERRARSGKPVAVITDKTLPKQAAKGQITYAEPSKKGEGAASSIEPSPVRDEQYWRSRALEIRQRWKNAADEAAELEENAARLRRRFYDEADPYVRDTKVKPEWDRVLDRLTEVRADIETAKRELEALQEEGRRAGALPGWLREGAELEPVEEESADRLPTTEPTEPPMYEERPPV